MNAEGLKGLELSKETLPFIESIDIGIKRSFDGYPFPSGVTKEQRLEIMNIVEKACI
jgi:hypothetical protein